MDKSFFSKYEIKELIRNDKGFDLAIYLKMQTSDFFKDNVYHNVFDETVEMQLAKDLDMPITIVEQSLKNIDSVGLLIDYQEGLKHDIHCIYKA